MEAGLAKRKKGGVTKTTNGFVRGTVNSGNSANGKFRRSSRGSAGASSSSGGGSGGKKYFRCTTCSYVTHVKARFTKHVKYHSMPLIKCNFCDFKTPYKWNLDRHLKNHNDDGELKCPLCNFSTDIKQSLTVHVQNHHTSVPEHQRVALGLHVQLGPEEYENDENEENVSGGDEYYGDEIVPAPGEEGAGEEEDEEERVVVEGSLGQALIEMDQEDDGEEGKENDDDEVEEEDEEQRKNKKKEQEESEDENVPEGAGAAAEGKKANSSNGKDGKKEEEVDEMEDFEKKSLFLQSLSLKPNVVYSVGNVGPSLLSPPKLTTSKSGSSNGSPQPSRRPSVTSELSGNKKQAGASSGGEAKKNKEKKLGLEELTQKLVAKSEENGSGMFKNSVTITSNSTRCQFCRQRCKTSTDLALHLTVCSEAQHHDEDYGDDDDESSNDRGEGFSNLSDDGPVPCTSENKIFVWNNKPDGCDEEMMDYGDFKGHFLDASGSSDELVGFETAPGVGAVHVGQLEEAEYEGYRGGEGYDDLWDGKGSSVTTTRKVFRCPQPNCGFWATTASRFHVHIVGHYNMKPFECSQCSYKSNWRWDITKHIKLKEMRDPAHAKAKVLLTHESGQRNYRKYDRYLVMMQLKHSADSKLPDCSTVASKRSDVEMELSPSPGAPVVVASPKVSPQQQQSKPAVTIAMPKLTRAPITSRASSPSESVKSEEGGHRPRPPPALVPISAAASSSGSIGSAGRTIVEKKMLSGGRILAGDTNGLLAAVSALPEISLEPCSANGQVNPPPPRKRPRGSGTEAKKILWKCKKCPFKHSSKEIVVFHIRQFHKPKRGESVSILSQNHLMSVPDDEDSQETCEPPQPRKPKLAAAKETHQYRYIEKDEIFRCKFCPFSTAAIVAMEAHSENHFSKPNCNFSCNQCSFSVSTKRELMEHVFLHGPEALPADEGDSLTITAEETPPKSRSTNGTHKKYHCIECPYVTDSKGQFLYHKQFHKSRDCPFKCPQCSYNVSHKHLLHQHLRVHGLAPLSPSHGDVTSLADHDEGDEEQPLDLHLSNDVAPADEAAHPTVLVWRNGRPFRMYRCRFCPQVFGKLGDLTDHEITHNSSAAQSPLQSQQNVIITPVNPTLVNGGINGGVVNLQSKVLYCCDACPARFFHEKELDIHSTFHQIKSEFKCELCTYSAKQQNPHLMSHMKVHGPEYQLKTQQLLQRYPKAPKKKKQQQSPTNVPKPMAVPLNIPKVIPGHFLAKSLTSSPKTSHAKSNVTVYCSKCPARFQSQQSYNQHSTFHGRQSIFRCRNCDYGVDTLKNLTLHELLHAGSEVSSDFEIAGQDGGGAPSGKKTKSGAVISPTLKDEDTLEDEAYVGNPDFVYPTYIKNGRVKSKRYKCSKCPSAFEKRDQYKVHMGLHGSDQRYRCTVCDYAVTYYANFIQHLKKHSTQADVPPELLVAKPLSKMRTESVPGNAKSSSSSSTTASSSAPKAAPKKFGCTECSFKTGDEKTLNEHMGEHEKSPSYHKCYFCAFVASSKADLKEHVRLHFQVPTDSVQTCLFSDEVDTSYDEKNVSEKENYDDEKPAAAKGSILKSKLSGDVKQNGMRKSSTEGESGCEDDGAGDASEAEDDDGDEDDSHSQIPSPQPMDCTV